MSIIYLYLKILSNEIKFLNSTLYIIKRKKIMKFIFIKFLNNFVLK